MQPRERVCYYDVGEAEGDHRSRDCCCDGALCDTEHRDDGELNEHPNEIGTEATRSLFSTTRMAKKSDKLDDLEGRNSDAHMEIVALPVKLFFVLQLFEHGLM